MVMKRLNLPLWAYFPLGLALGASVPLGLAVSGTLSDPDGNVVPGYLGQDTLSICVDSPAGTGDEIIINAIEFGRAELWQDTYLEAAPIAVEEGCPTGPPADSGAAKIVSEPTSRFSILVFVIDDEQRWSSMNLSRAPDVALLSYELFRRSSHFDEFDGLTYALYIRSQETLKDSGAVADAIGAAYGIYPEDLIDGNECEGPKLGQRGAEFCKPLPAGPPPSIDPENPSG